MTVIYRDLIERGALARPDNVAIVFGQQQLTFRQTHTLSNQLAHALRALGIGHQERVALLLNNSLYSVPMDFACAKTGINRVPLNARLSAAEHGKMLAETDCQTLVYGADLAERALELQALAPNLRCLGLGSAAVGGDDLLAIACEQATGNPAADLQADDIALTLFTSGTTGTLKATQHTQGSYAAICRNVLLNLINAGPNDAMLHAASLIHASGVFVLPFWLRGARTIIMPTFSPADFLQHIAQHRVTAVNLVPTMLQMLMEHPGFNDADVSSLTHVIYGASPMPRPILEKAMAAWGQEGFWQYYGQTECPLTISVLRPEDHTPQRLGSCGRPALDVELRLVDSAGRDVPAGEPGEILVRAPSRMRGYYNAPELNAEMLTADGWLRTRDVAALDEQGYLYIKDRTSDMIITGGYNVYPREVEDVLMAHPAVADCAVIGLKDDKWVEAVTAVVAVRPGQSVDEQTLIAFVAGQVASYKKPRQVIFQPSIPKTAVGKLNRKALRDSLSEAR